MREANGESWASLYTHNVAYSRPGGKATDRTLLLSRAQLVYVHCVGMRSNQVAKRIEEVYKVKTDNHPSDLINKHLPAVQIVLA